MENTVYYVMYIYCILHTVYSVKMKKITISYPDEQFEWLERHPEINKSGVFRKAISHMMANESSALTDGDLDLIANEVSQESL